MGRACSVCVNPKRDEIDQALVDGQAYSAIARRFEIGRDAVRRHALKHLPATLAKAREAEEIAHAGDILQRAKEYESRALSLLEIAEKEGKVGLALKAVKETREGLKLLAALSVALEQKRETSDLLNSPEWIELKAAIVRALQPFPNAKAAVYRALRAPQETGGKR